MSSVETKSGNEVDSGSTRRPGFNIKTCCEKTSLSSKMERIKSKNSETILKRWWKHYMKALAYSSLLHKDTLQSKTSTLLTYMLFARSMCEQEIESLKQNYRLVMKSAVRTGGSPTLTRLLFTTSKEDIVGTVAKNNHQSSSSSTTTNESSNPVHQSNNDRIMQDSSQKPSAIDSSPLQTSITFAKPESPRTLSCEIITTSSSSKLSTNTSEPPKKKRRVNPIYICKPGQGAESTEAINLCRNMGHEPGFHSCCKMCEAYFFNNRLYQ